MQLRKLSFPSANFLKRRSIMPENIGTANYERRVSDNSAELSGCSSKSIGTFNLRRRQYLNKARFNGIERRSPRAGIAKAEMDT